MVLGRTLAIILILTPLTSGFVNASPMITIDGVVQEPEWDNDKSDPDLDPWFYDDTYAFGGSGTGAPSALIIYAYWFSDCTHLYVAVVTITDTTDGYENFKVLFDAFGDNDEEIAIGRWWYGLGDYRTGFYELPTGTG